MSYTMYNNNNLMHEIKIKEYGVRNTNISILKEAKQHPILSGYKTPSLNAQIKLSRRKTNLY